MGKIIRNIDVAIGKFKGKLTKLKALQLLENIKKGIKNVDNLMIGRTIFKLKKDKVQVTIINNLLQKLFNNINKLKERVKLD